MIGKLLKYIVLFYLGKIQKSYKEGYYSNIFSLNNDHISRYITIFGIYEEKELKWILEFILLPLKNSKKEISILDVGANIGNYSLFFSKVAKHVLAFEPNPVARMILEANKLYNNADNIKIFPQALGDQKKRVQLEQGTVGNLGSATILDENLQHNIKTVSVDMIRGDDLLLELKPDLQVDFIKIDVEGFEFQVLKGLNKILSSSKPVIMFESNTAKDRQKITSYLSELGYKYFLFLDGRSDYSKYRAVRWLQKLKDINSIQVFELDHIADRSYPVCLAVTEEQNRSLNLHLMQ